MIRSVPGTTHLVLHSGLVQKRTTLSEPSLEYFLTNAKWLTDQLLRPTL